jgi:hypothetical protein
LPIGGAAGSFGYVLLLDVQSGNTYHLNTHKVQGLGDLRPKRYHYTPCVGIRGAFPYTPCMIGEFPENFSKT